MAQWLDQLDSSGRYALLKIMTGALRIGVTARLAKQALAAFAREQGQDVDIVEIEELWHGLEPPYESLFAWLTGTGDKPIQAAAAPFRPVMLATPLADTDMTKLNPADFAAEWKWDGIRVQVTAEGGTRRLYSRTGDDIGAAFPDLLDAMTFEGSLDGELLVGRMGDDGIEAGTFGDLQQRLNRKSVGKKLLATHPVFVRAYDLLADGEENLRALTFDERRKRLEAFVPSLDPTRFDISALVPFQTWDDVATARENVPHPIVEGLMLKRWDSTYVPGRPKGPWFKWKKDPFLIDAVLLYAQRGHGKRSSYYSDYTFGVWKGDDLVPVGKAYFGFTDEELKQIDKFVRDNTRERFGPVRSVTANQRVRPRAGNRLRGPEPVEPPQVRRRHAFSPHFPPALGQAHRRSRYVGKPRSLAAAGLTQGPQATKRSPGAGADPRSAGRKPGSVRAGNGKVFTVPSLSEPETFDSNLINDAALPAHHVPCPSLTP